MSAAAADTANTAAQCDDGERRHVDDARHGEMMSAFARVYAERRRNARFVRKISAEMRASS